MPCRPLSPPGILTQRSYHGCQAISMPSGSPQEVDILTPPSEFADSSIRINNLPISARTPNHIRQNLTDAPKRQRFPISPENSISGIAKRPSYCGICHSRWASGCTWVYRIANTPNAAPSSRPSPSGTNTRLISTSTSTDSRSRRRSGRGNCHSKVPGCSIDR